MKLRIYLIVKRFFDIVAALLAIVIFIIPWCIIALVIKLKSPGPVIFKARRVGQNGKIFTLYKFRSMCTDSGKIHATTLRNDSRIFPFGKFLRNSKLDETPQLINIIKGEMSIIGPRPEDEDNSEQFYTGKYRQILNVKPGLSSPASLYDYTHGELYETEEEYVVYFMPRKLDMELYYVNHRSWIYDLEIIVRTIIVIIQIIVGKKNFEEPKEVMICQALKEKPFY